MSMSELMALVPLESAKSVRAASKITKWEKPVKAIGQTGGTRFGSVDDKPFLPPPFIDLPAGMSYQEVDLFLREQRYDDLSQKLASGELELGDPDIRPSSPPPTYDKNGARTNQREARVRNAMTAEYHRLVDYIYQRVEGFQPPPDWKPLKKIRRIEIPLDKYPEYNFMGLIIGPRGCNHKRLETESGTQISVRGKGTQKEGRKTDHQTEEEASLPMHVHIQADTDEKLEKAVELIEPLLDPFHPMHENFKKRGLEQLALVNGFSVAKIDQRCAVCGGTGHLTFECPDAPELQNFKKPQVKCAICGDEGHVTMDCKQARGTAFSQGRFIPTPPPGGPPTANAIVSPQHLHERQKVDHEYQKMMKELTGSSGSAMDVPDEGTAQPANNDPSFAPGVSPTPNDVHAAARRMAGINQPYIPNDMYGFKAPTNMYPPPPWPVQGGYMQQPTMPWMTGLPNQVGYPGQFQMPHAQGNSWGPIAPPPQFQCFPPGTRPTYPSPSGHIQTDAGSEDCMDTSN